MIDLLRHIFRIDRFGVLIGAAYIGAVIGDSFGGDAFVWPGFVVGLVGWVALGYLDWKRTRTH